MPGRMGAPRQRGLTVVELAAVVALAGVVVAAAMAASGALGAALWPVNEGLRTQSRLVALRAAVTAWYRAEYCGANAKPVALPVALAHEPVAEGGACAVRVGGAEGVVQPSTCLSEFLPLELAATRPALSASPPPAMPPVAGTFAWEIVSPLPPDPVPADWRWPKPQLRIFWRLPEHARGRGASTVAALAGELGAYCDDDGNADTAELCDGAPAGGEGALLVERFVWAAPIAPFDEASAWVTRQRRLRDWLSAHALDCDADRHRITGAYDPGHDVMDAFCDGPIDDELVDAGHVIDANGDGCDDARARPPLDTAHPRHSHTRPRANFPCPSPVPVLLDADEDGVLDYDVTGDFVVDQADFHALGC